MINLTEIVEKKSIRSFRRLWLNALSVSEGTVA